MILIVLTQILKFDFNDFLLLNHDCSFLGERLNKRKSLEVEWLVQGHALSCQTDRIAKQLNPSL